MSIDNTILEFKHHQSATQGNNNNNSILLTNSKTSSIQVNIKDFNLKIYNEIVVSWNIMNNEETSESDWIGIYKTDGKCDFYLVLEERS